MMTPRVVAYATVSQYWLVFLLCVEPKILKINEGPKLPQQPANDLTVDDALGDSWKTPCWVMSETTPVKAF